MRLVSAEEATERLVSLREGHVTNTKAHIEHLYETILALWPSAKWAARQPCQSPIPIGMVREQPCGKCDSCLARKLVKEAQGKDVPANSPGQDE